MSRTAEGSSVEAILLAAGESTRMGSPKALLDWGGVPLVRYQIGQLLASGASRVIVVIGHQAETVRLASDADSYPAGAVTVVVNTEYRTGKASSLRVGASALSPGATGALVVAVDQPRPAEVVSTLVRSHAESPESILVPSYAGRRGHPTLVPARLFEELARVDDATMGLRQVLMRNADSVVEMPTSDPSVLLDLNDPESYNSAKPE